ncbi:prepilin peptidase [Breoghania corrubedonensis]|nr:A24 family peptidase [Breoghania corrubedonensis]
MVTALVFFALAVAIGALGWVMFGAMPAQVVLASMVLAIPLAWGAAVDWHDFIVPDRVSLGLIPLGLGMTWLVNPAVLSAHIVAALAGGLLLWVVAQGYRRFRGVAGLGLGDVKLLAAAGAWLGPEGLPGVLLIGSLAAIAALLVRRGLTGPRALRGRIAFAPYLALGIWVTWIFGSITWGA